MKIALVTDTHFGARGDNLQFAAYFKKFYDEVFFPYLKENNIRTLIHLGDIVDRRKFINFQTAKILRETFIEPIVREGIDAHLIIGNHDTYYKNTNEVNSMAELYEHGVYPNLHFYSRPEVVDFDGEPIIMMPWICNDTKEESFDIINSGRSQVLMGHLEIHGFEMYKNNPVHIGMDQKLFSGLDVVCSGHFHTRSTRGNITYLGCPYEMTWSDYDDPKGFHVYDTETRSLEFIENPNRMFHKVKYDDVEMRNEDIVAMECPELAGGIVKVIVKNKTNPFFFDLFIDKIEKAGVVDLQVVEDHLNLDLQDDEDIIDEAEDTLTILTKYIDQLEDVDKVGLEQLIRNLYNEALVAQG